MRRMIVGAVLAGIGAGCGGGRGDRSRPRTALVDTAPAALAPADDRPVVLCFGTSLTAGLGLAPDSAYPALLQRKGIPHNLDLWGYDVPHDWPTWRKMLPAFVAYHSS